MQANRKTVKGIVNTLANMTASGIYRRAWCDKTKAKDNERLLTFRFWDSKEADEVARRLQFTLETQGYTNKVKRTSVRSNYATYTEGGEYVRVKALFS